MLSVVQWVFGGIHRTTIGPAANVLEIGCLAVVNPITGPWLLSEKAPVRTTFVSELEVAYLYRYSIG